MKAVRCGLTARRRDDMSGGDHLWKSLNNLIHRGTYTLLVGMHHRIGGNVIQAVYKETGFTPN